MKVKEILFKLQHEHPDAEVTPCTDENGDLAVLVTPPATNDGGIGAYAEAVRVLGSHAKRIERIRLEVAAFYGLPVGFRITCPPQSSDNIEFIVTSPTGEIMVQADLGVDYILKTSEAGHEMNQVRDRQSQEPCVRFKDVDSNLAGYHFRVHKYVLSKEKLAEAIKRFCDPPKLAEERAAIVIA